MCRTQNVSHKRNNYNTGSGGQKHSVPGYDLKHTQIIIYYMTSFPLDGLDQTLIAFFAVLYGCELLFTVGTLGFVVDADAADM